MGGLPGWEMIETPEQARVAGRRWRRMASEIDTPDAPEEARSKARELRSRADHAYRWARQQDAALRAGQQTHDEHAGRPDRGGEVVPIRRDQPATRQPRSTAAARRAGHAVYDRLRPKAMTIRDRGRTHFFQGAREPFGPVGSGFDLAIEALGTSLAIVLLYDLLRSPGAIVQTSSHLSAAIERAVGLSDPITGRQLAAAAAPAAPRQAVTTHGPTL